LEELGADLTMTRNSQRAFVVAGTLLIVLVNAIVLAGVARNRAAPPASQFALTEREISPLVEWSLDSDNSGLGASLSIRTPSTGKSPDRPSALDGPVFGWGDAPWLTPDKLKALGFRISPDGISDAGKRQDQKLLPKDVYVVLEFNGASYQATLQEAADKAARTAESAAANPADTRRQLDARFSQEQVESVRHRETRLYCVDAGLDPDALRRAYPDPSTYAIVRGSIRPSVVERQGTWRVVGRFSGVRISKINVPLNFRSVFGSAKRFTYNQAMSMAIAGLTADRNPPRHYTVTVDWGRHLEPWIVNAAPVEASAP
jgi:hypothetical protein